MESNKNNPAFRLEQNITSLDLPRCKISKLQSLGKNYRADLDEGVLNSLSISLKNIPKDKTALELYEEDLLNGCILSLNSDLDQVLKDEIVPRKITELSGLPGSGKTQICFQLCITVQLPKDLGGVEGEAIFINTNKNFSSRRVRELSRQFIKQLEKLKSNENILTEDDILKNIHVVECDSFLEFSACIKYLETILRSRKNKIKLVVIDSFSNPLREIQPAERTSLIYQLFENLQTLADSYSFAIVVTNDFTTRIKDNEAYYTPSFGDSFFHRINTRICLSCKNAIYYASLVKSPTKAPVKIPYSMF